MLQNPSKYHPNPLSHFLALHNSANHHHNHHQTSHQGSQFHHHGLNGNHLNTTGMVNTSLDVGKSFTIAAILGLQKNAIEHHQQNQRDFNSVMNLSLNGHHNQKNNNSSNNLDNCGVNNNNNNSNNNTNTNNNNNNINNNNNVSNINSNNNNSSGLNSFDCDSVNSVVNRYLPNSSSGGGGGVVNNSVINSAGHLRIASNHFGVVASTTNINAPSALQSLQQLHQHHAQQQAVNLGYQRDKIKNDNLSTKKSSLKSKRVRTIFTPEQLERLEAEFERQQYMVGPERLYLAHTLQLTEAQVKVWFQNRRIKWRKHHLEITQQRLAIIRQTQIINGEDAGSSTILLNGMSNDAADVISHNESREILSDVNSSPSMLTPNQNNHHSESDLSICNDSIDGDSIIEGDET